MAGEDPLTLHHTFKSLKRSGGWHVPGVIHLKQRMGSMELDFTEATFDAMDTDVDVDMIGGSIELRVPAGVQVDAHLATTFASYQDHRPNTGGTADRRILLHGRAILGSIEVRA